MSRGRGLPRAAAAAVLLVGALLAGGLTAAVASAKPAPDAAVDDVIVVQPFAADSGDRCPRGFTKGQLGWHAGALAVDLDGVVGDQPLPGNANPACAEDRRATTAYFTAYAGASVLDAASVGANNSERVFPDALALHASRPIEAVTVQVCRISLAPPPSPLPPFPPPPPPPVRICGPVHRYAAPAATTG